MLHHFRIPVTGPRVKIFGSKSAVFTAGQDVEQLLHRYRFPILTTAVDLQSGLMQVTVWTPVSGLVIFALSMYSFAFCSAPAACWAA